MSTASAPEPTIALAPTARPLRFLLWSVIAAFGTYFCMYGFRKPFTAATFEGITFLSLSYKVVLVASQVFGYTLSKFIGIKVISEMTPSKRAAGILLLIGIAQLALLAFALVPPPFNLLCLFVNGLPLGMVFGLVLGFLEGRNLTEALTAGLCASFILAGGATKSVGTYLLSWGVSQWWMPFVAGCVFLMPLLGFVWMLTRIPPPTAEDIEHRTERVPMSGSDRMQFFLRYSFGLTMIGLVYLFVTILRSMRDDFAPEIWKGLGYEAEPNVFFWSELWVMLGVVIANGLAVLVINNRRAFNIALGTGLFGLLLVAASVLGWQSGLLDPFPFMVLIGLGLYLPYVAVHTTIFERLIAMTRDRGNLGYLMYLVDAFGYLGYVGVIVVKNFITTEKSNPATFVVFFRNLSMVAAIASILCLGMGWFYFSRKRPAPVVTDTNPQEV